MMVGEQLGVEVLAVEHEEVEGVLKVVGVLVEAGPIEIHQTMILTVMVG